MTPFTFKIDYPVVNHFEVRDGDLRMAGRNLKVRMVIGMLVRAGASIEEVAEQYDLSRAEVHAVLAYYYDHQSEIDRYFAEEDRFADEHIPSIETLKGRWRR
ncbi:MAG: DUF433 domain-containing protein [Anaerolineae bacterium]|nr:DUF433 domain-containing protein [Anaerolineae bacterium]